MSLSANYKKSIEKLLYPSHFDEEIIVRSSTDVNQQKVFIIPQDNPDKIKEAYWAYKDPTLEDIMELQDLMKCVIVVKRENLESLSKAIDRDEFFIIKGVCIDHGEENYIAYPEGGRVNSFQELETKDISEYFAEDSKGKFFE